MIIKEITSKDNSLIKLVCSLQSSAKARKESGSFVLEGLRLCDDAYSCSIRFDKLIFSSSACEKYSEMLDNFSKNSNEVYKVPDSLFNRISDTSSPQGIIAVCSNVAITEKPFDKNGRYVALENLADPSNVGAIARTAEALGVSGMIITSGSCDPYSPKVLRASMGTVLRLPIYFTDDIIAFLEENSIKSYACVVNADAKKISEVEFSDGSAVLIGNEANGLEDTTVKKSSCPITIEMRGRAESLNASMAAAIAIWEMMR